MTYDDWKLSGPDAHDKLGTEPGQPCNRIDEPDEDNPRPTRCDGTMTDEDGGVFCDVCGWMK